MHDGAGWHGRLRLGILIHQFGEQGLVQRSPVHTDAHGGVVGNRDLDHLREIAVLLFLEADIAGIDAVFVQRPGAIRILGEQQVAIVVKVPHQRHGHVHLQEAFADFGHGGGGFFAVNCDADKFRAGAGQFSDLLCGAFHVCRIRVGHGLHDDGCAATDFDVTDIDAGRCAARMDG